MTVNRARIAAAVASMAALSMAASPAHARHWGGGWGGWDRHHDRSVDVGDVLTGILIIGGIAAIASAASSNNRDRRRDDRGDNHRGQNGSYPGDRSAGYGNDNDQQWQLAGGIDKAVGQCAAEVSRGSARVQAVESIDRDGDGWRVQGRTGSGQQFTCVVDAGGQIRTVQVDGRAY